MRSQLEEKQPLFYKNVIETLKEKERVQHAYLIETNFIDNKEEYILEFVENLFQLKLDDQILPKEKLHQYLIENHFPDLKILKPLGNMIKKEDLLNIKQSFLTKSIYNGYQIYIIYDAEKLNSSSANTILKFLEEPEENIIAVLVTNSRYQILDTILSRCQILSFQQENKDVSTLSAETRSFIELLADRNKKNLMISFQIIFDEILQNREHATSILSELNDFFAKILRNYYNIEEIKNIENEQYQTSFSEEEILNILSIIENKKTELEYNVNFKTWMDSLLLQLTEV